MIEVVLVERCRSLGDAEKKSADAQVETNLCGAGDFGFLGGCLNA